MLSFCPRVCLCGTVPRHTSCMRLIFTPVGVNRGLLCVQAHTLHVRRMCVCVVCMYVLMHTHMQYGAIVSLLLYYGTYFLDLRGYGIALVAPTVFPSSLCC